ncbi:hypothetical protein LWI29_023332 [Acer saccharum]|uniref:Uncharacterized protein n=1 Tax=Acer saccharum TaxID=4024 RepID=A0AA39RDZ4_ACESA|nr:hypothetical protein LWI29_023332 [Acer saccharum]
MGWNSDEVGSDLEEEVCIELPEIRKSLYGIYRVLKSQNWVEGEKNSDCCQWEKVECNKRLRWVGGLGRDLNLEEGQFQSPMEGGCPDEVSMELPIASNLVTVPVMWDGSVSC